MSAILKLKIPLSPARSPISPNSTPGTSPPTSPTSSKLTKKTSFLSLFQKQSKFVKFLLISDERSDDDGPWLDNGTPTSLTSPSIKISTSTSKNKIQQIHLMTISPIVGDLRRIQVFQHRVKIIHKELSEISHLISTDPAKGLVITDRLLKSPYSKEKLVDKQMSTINAVIALCRAQISLVPLFGAWLSPQSPQGITAASDTVYVCSHCLCHGTIALALKANTESGSSSQHIRDGMVSGLQEALLDLFSAHPDCGFSVMLVAPMGVSKEGVVHT